MRECYLDNTRTPYTDKHNINEFRFIKRTLKPWQQATCKNKLNKYNRYQWHEAYTSDPVEAKETATSRLQRFQQSVQSRGEARECKPYTPPPNIHEQILAICKSIINSSSREGVIPKSVDDQSVLNIDLNQSKALKFDFITRCMKEFDHDVPSSCLNELNTMSDVIEYFSTEVRGINPFDSLLGKQNLPDNLSILPVPDRYNKETDTNFKGFSALPGVVSKVPGLRAGKKYPILNQDEFQWPDI